MVCPCSNDNFARSGQVGIPVPTCFPTIGDYRAAYCLNVTAFCESCSEDFDLSPCPDFNCPPSTITFPVFRVTGSVDLYLSREVMDACGNSTALCLDNPVTIPIDFSCTLCPDADCASLVADFNERPCAYIETLPFIVYPDGSVEITVSLVDCDIVRERSEV